MIRKLSCTYCNQSGHYRPRCPALAYDRGRMTGIDDANAARAFDPSKNPMHWEVLNSKRALVAAQLIEALEQLSSAAPAAKSIKRAMKLLEDVK